LTQVFFSQMLFSCVHAARFPDFPPVIEVLVGMTVEQRMVTGPAQVVRCILGGFGTRAVFAARLHEQPDQADSA
jgi:hypothetical protein